MDQKDNENIVQFLLLVDFIRTAAVFFSNKLICVVILYILLRSKDMYVNLYKN